MLFCMLLFLLCGFDRNTKVQKGYVEAVGTLTRHVAQVQLVL